MDRILSQTLLLSSLVVLTTPTSALSQDGIAFNGTYYASPAITGGTSELENTAANVLNGVTQVTVCF